MAIKIKHFFNYEIKAIDELVSFWSPYFKTNDCSYELFLDKDGTTVKERLWFDC